MKPTEARPGDIMYYKSTEGYDGTKAGAADHAVVVTGVLPNNEVLYTQHDPMAADRPLNGRLSEYEERYGHQDVEIVRPKVTW